MPRAVTSCPRCGATVSQFAAGCSICGEDIESHRRNRAARPSVGNRLGRIEPGFMQSADSRDAVVFVVVLGLVTLMSPLFGLFAGGWTAYVRNREGNDLGRNLAIAIVLLAVVMLAVPDLRYGLLIRLFA